LRIDHLLLNAELAPRLRSAGVDRWVRDRPRASDHAPTWTELNGREEGRSETAAQHGRVKHENQVSRCCGSIAWEQSEIRS
jgi:exodeoxyribonuclease-3